MNINFELMEVKRMFVTLTSLMALSLGPVSAQAQTGTEKVNEKFHIYLCLGQSNMEGNAKIEACDTVNVTPRFKVLQAVDCPDERILQHHKSTKADHKQKYPVLQQSDDEMYPSHSRHLLTK